MEKINRCFNLIQSTLNKKIFFLEILVICMFILIPEKLPPIKSYYNINYIIITKCFYSLQRAFNKKTVFIFILILDK